MTICAISEKSVSEIIDTRSSVQNCEILIKMRPMSKPKFVTELCPVTLLLMSYGNSQSVDPDSNPEPSANVVVVACTRVLLLNNPLGVPHLAPQILSQS